MPQRAVQGLLERSGSNPLEPMVGRQHASARLYNDVQLLLVMQFVESKLLINYIENIYDLFDHTAIRHPKLIGRYWC